MNLLSFVVVADIFNEGLSTISKLLARAIFGVPFTTTGVRDDEKSFLIQLEDLSFR